MARSTTYETQIRIGAKYTGGPEIAKANRDIDRTERNVKGLGVAMQRARRHFFDFGKVAAGAFAGFTAAGIVGAAVRGMKDLGLAAFKAADEVVRLREGNKRLLMTYGMTSKQAAETEKRLYGVATAMEKGVGHDAEIMSKILVGMQKSLSTEEIEKNQAAISGYFTAISEGAPSIEKGQQAFEELNNLFMRGKGPALNLMKWDKERIKIFQKLSTDQRKYYGLIRLNQLYGHQTAEFFKTDTGKMNYAMTLFGNLLEDVGEEAVGQKGKIADLLISIATQLDPIAKDLGKIVGYELKKWLEDVNKGMPDTIANWTKWKEQLGMVSSVLDGIAWHLNQINALNDKVPVIFDLPKWIRDHAGVMKAWTPGTIVTPQIPGAVDWRYGGSTGQPTTTEEANKQHEAARKEEEDRQGRMRYPPYERESKALQEIKRAESAAVGPGDSPGLAQKRASAIAELEADPALRDKLYRVAQAEVGTGNPKRLQAFVEGLLTRSGIRKGGLKAALQPNYYETLRKGPLALPSASDRAKMDEAIKRAKGGSNVGNYGTGNFAFRGGGLGGAGGYPSAFIGGEQFSVQAADAKEIARIKAFDQAEKAKKANKPSAKVLEDVIPLLQEGAGAYPLGEPLIPDSAYMKDPRRQGPINRLSRDINASERTSGVGGGTNVAMNSPVTINGVPAGREGAVGREVTRALQDPDRLLLAQLKSARGSEQRLTYNA